jgi:hypothetical protein
MIMAEALGETFPASDPMIDRPSRAIAANSYEAKPGLSNNPAAKGGDERAQVGTCEILRLPSMGHNQVAHTRRSQRERICYRGARLIAGTGAPV